MEAASSDEKESRTIFIIKRHQNSLKQIETYLRNRNWNVQSTDDIKQAIVLILKAQPKFVLVSVEHPHPKASFLPKILNQAIHCHILPYAEISSPKILKKLNDVGAAHILFPPVSGPAIDRMLNSILIKEKDPQNQNESSIQVKGSLKKNESDKTIVAKGKIDPAALAKMFSDEKTESDEGEQIIQKGMGIGELHSTEQGPPGPARTSSVHLHTDSAGNLGDVLPEDKTEIQSHSKKEESSVTELAKEKKQSEELVEQNSLGAVSTLEPTHAGVDAHPQNELQNQGEQPPVQTTDHNPNPKPHLSLARDVETKPRTINHQDEYRIELEPVPSITRVACLMVRSLKFSGYLLVSISSEKKIDINFIANLRLNLFRFLREKGQVVTSEDELELKLEAVQFQDLASNYIDFLQKSISSDKEVTMAFLPNKKIDIKLEKAPTEDMFGLDLHQLDGDTNVEFDIYIYLPVNNKYLLFTPKGNILYENQKDRLLKRSISRVYVPKNSEPDVRRYKIRNDLNKMIGSSQGDNKSTGASGF